MLLLEAHAGEEAAGAFVTENQFERPVTTTMVADPITGPDGAVLSATLKLDPPVVSLDAGERCVVRVSLTITEAFTPGTEYRTVIRGPDLPGTSIPVVLRRPGP